MSYLIENNHDVVKHQINKSRIRRNKVNSKPKLGDIYEIPGLIQRYDYRLYSPIFLVVSVNRKWVLLVPGDIRHSTIGEYDIAITHGKNECQTHIFRTLFRFCFPLKSLKAAYWQDSVQIDPINEMLAYTQGVRPYTKLTFSQLEVQESKSYQLFQDSIQEYLIAIEKLYISDKKTSNLDYLVALGKNYSIL